MSALKLVFPSLAIAGKAAIIVGVSAVCGFLIVSSNIAYAAPCRANNMGSQ